MAEGTAQTILTKRRRERPLRAFLEVLLVLDMAGLLIRGLRDYEIWGVPILPSIGWIIIVAWVGVESRAARDKFS